MWGRWYCFGLKLICALNIVDFVNWSSGHNIAILQRKQYGTFGTDCFVDLGVVNYWRGKICRAQMHSVINCGYNSIKAASFRLLVLVLTRNRGHWQNSQFITRPVHIHLHGNSQCFRGSYSIFSTAVMSWSFWTCEWTYGIFVNWATENLLDIVAKAAFTKIRQ